MFKKFSKDDVHTRTNVKSSVAKTLKSKLVSQYPKLEDVIDEIIPKKVPISLYKCEDKIQLYVVNNEILFYQQFDDLIPELRLVHKYPDAFPSVQVDRGAIKFVLSGANIMCPGLTSPGAKLPEEDWPVNKIVVVYAEGKENAMAVGKLAMSINDIKTINKDTGIELYEYLNDGMWNFRD
ncbi:translation machinery-associated protein 20 [Pichia kluyveri]|uniref:Translation machinery-associated protein 20 n=1 Tax=Pichia kluyveri TaxID=36015 RepID=A0AAV5R7Z6_PICKL|nr:translation machinery-associated protein 20 [Pichia kluyveri]